MPESGPAGISAPPLTTDLVVDPHTPREDEWERASAQSFQRRMLDTETPFPCIFGVDALRKATLRYSFIARNDDRVRVLAGALRDFVELAPLLGIRTSLVTFFQDTDVPRTVEEYREEFWELLQAVHDMDTEPWPADVSPDPEHEKWEFTFAGMPMFVVVNTPAHQRRASRHFDTLMVTFQPRFVFDDISEDTKQGRNARTIIRARLKTYDQVPASPLLGSFGADGNREWVQYFLEDDNSPVVSGCPLHVKQEEKVQ